MEFNDLFARYCSDFGISYERKIVDSTSVARVRAVIAELTTMEGLLDSITDMATLTKFLLSAECADLWPLKNRIIESAPQTIVFDPGNRDELARRITDAKKAASKKLGALCLAEFLEKGNTYDTRKRIPEVRQRLIKWLDAGTEDELAVLLFTNVHSAPSRDLLSGIKEAGYLNELRASINKVFVAPFSTDRDHEALTASSHTPLVLMSELLKEVEGHLADILTVTMLVPGTLVMDADLADAQYHGKNVALICGSIDLACGDKVIDVSGKPGAHAPAQPAPSGQSYREVDEGGKKVTVADQGKNGACGENATTSGDVLISYSKLSGSGKLTVKANGANGGNGQKGGEGNIGATGDPGPNGDRWAPRLFLANDWNAYYYFYEGYPGKKGKQGGQAGDGGHSGSGSKGGAVYLVGEAAAGVERSTADGAHGVAGKAGERGARGPGGPAGRHGLLREERYGAETQDEFDYFYGDEDFTARWSDFAAMVAGMPEGDLKKEFLSGVGKTGEPGERGDFGKDGKIAGSSEPKELLANPQRLFPNSLIVRHVVQLFKNPANRDFLLHDSGIFDARTLTPAFLYLLFKEMDDLEKASAGREPGEGFLELAGSIYRAAQKNILSSATGAGADLQVILFIISQRLSYLSERAAGGGANGNQVVNLELLAKHMKTFLEESASVTVAERKEHYYKEFNTRLKNGISAAARQVSTLRERIEALMDKSAQDIAHILSEIAHMKEEEEKYKEELIQKREALESEMALHLLFSGLSSMASVVGTISGAGSVFSELTQTIGQAAAGRGHAQVSIDELRNKIKHDQEIIRANHDLINQRYRPTIDPPEGIPFSTHEQVIDQLDLTELAKKRTHNEQEVDSYLLQMKELEIEKLRTRWEADCPDRKEKLKGIDAEMEALMEKNEDLPQMLFDFRKAEVDALKANQDIQTDKARLENLETYSKLLGEQEEYYRRKKTTSIIGQTLGVASALYSGISNFIETVGAMGSGLQDCNIMI